MRLSTVIRVRDVTLGKQRLALLKRLQHSDFSDPVGVATEISLSTMLFGYT